MTVLVRFFHPSPSLLFTAPEEAKFFQLFPVRVRVEYPDPWTAYLDFTAKADDGVDDLFETVGYVVAFFFVFRVSFSFRRLMYVPIDFQQIVLFWIDALHIIFVAAPVGVKFESERLVLFFEFFDAIYVLEKFVFHEKTPMSAFFRTQQFFSSFVVVFERFVKTLEVMPPCPIEIAAF